MRRTCVLSKCGLLSIARNVLVTVPIAIVLHGWVALLVEMHLLLRFCGEAALGGPTPVWENGGHWGTLCF